jgi:hypothetical protein
MRTPVSAQTTQNRPPTVPERRSLPPSGDPVQGIPPGNTPREGPPLPGPVQAGQGLYWIVLHCSFEPNPQEEKEH